MGASAVKAGEAYVEIGGRDAPLAKALKRSKGRLLEFASKVRRIGSTFVKVGAVITTVIGAIGFVKAIKAAAEFEETLSKFNAVFKEQAAVTLEWANAFSLRVGRAEDEVIGFLASMQDTFVPLGFARDKAADLSKQITKLAVDVASFNNQADADVLRAFQSALVGNSESVRKFGIIITQAALSTELLTMGIAGGVRKATEQQKVMARLAIIFKSTTDAQGDAERTAGSFTNRMKALNAAFRNLAVTFGKVFLPALARLAEKIAKVIRKFAAWLDAGKRLEKAWVDLRITWLEVTRSIQQKLAIIGNVFSSVVGDMREIWAQLTDKLDFGRILALSFQVAWVEASATVKTFALKLIKVFSRLNTQVFETLQGILAYGNASKILAKDIKLVAQQAQLVTAKLAIKAAKALTELTGGKESEFGKKFDRQFLGNIEKKIKKTKKELADLFAPVVEGMRVPAKLFDPTFRIAEIEAERALKVAYLKEEMAKRLAPAAEGEARRTAEKAKAQEELRTGLKKINEEHEKELAVLKEKRRELDKPTRSEEKLKQKEDQKIGEAAKAISGAVGGFGAFASRLLSKQVPQGLQRVGERQVELLKQISENTASIRPGNAARVFSKKMNEGISGRGSFILGGEANPETRVTRAVDALRASVMFANQNNIKALAVNGQEIVKRLDVTNETLMKVLGIFQRDTVDAEML